MFRKFLCAVAILGLSLGFAMAEEIKGKITKVDGNKLTVATKDNKDGKVYECATACKVCEMKEKVKTEVAGGLTGIKTGEKGVGAVIVTGADGKVTEVILQGKKKE